MRTNLQRITSSRFLLLLVMLTSLTFNAFAAVPVTPILSGLTPVCQGTTSTYTVTNVDPTTTSYAWAYSGAGVTFAGSGSSINLTFTNSATTGDLTVTAFNTDGSSTSAPYHITVNPLPTLTGPLSGTATLCQNAGSTNYTVSGDANVTTFHWSYSGTGVSFSNLSASPTNAFSFGPSATSGIISVFGTNSCGTTPTVTYSVTVNPSTPAAFTINGSSNVCQGQNTVTYSVPSNPNVATYSWAYTGAGASITGNNTNSITVNFSNSATSGNITLTETNACGSTVGTPFAVAVGLLPTLTGPVSGTATLCQNAGATTYTANGDANVTTFHWSYTGTGVTFSNTTATNTNSLNFGTSATSGILSVFGTNTCGTTPTVTYSITVNPATPVAFSIAGTSPVCQGQNGVSYSVPANPNVSTYSWSYSGTGATISGNGTNAITINFGPTATGGTLTLNETNNCGTTPGTFVIAVTNAPTLTGPISGAATACQSTGPTTYTAAGGANITTYTWSYSGTGVTYSNTTATNTNDLTFGATATSGILSVFGTNSCGNTSTITYSITVNPGIPAAFTINGTSPVCQNQNGVSYSVPANPGVTNYSWTYSGTGATIAGNGTNAITMNFGAAATGGTLTLTETNSCGSTPGTFAIVVNAAATLTGPISGTTPVCQNAAPVTYTAGGGTGITSYNWSYSGTGTSFSNTTAGNTNSFTFGANATSGIISVTGTGTCGTTAPITYSVTVNPSAPAAFTINGTSPVCQGQNAVSYSVPANPNVSTYTWTYSGTNASITGNGTNAITMNFGPAATGGTLTLTEVNTCGSTPGTFTIVVNPATTLTGPISGSASVCQGAAAPVTYTAAGGAGITTYNWSYSGTGVTFSNATATNTNDLTFGANATSGVLSVFGTGACGTTATITYSITVNPAAPVAFLINGTSPVCQGQNGVSYSVPANAGVTTYSWVYTGTGATIAGNGTNAITMNFGATATGGNLTLTETNSCGTANNTFTIVVNPAATLTGPITGSTPVCQGAAAPVTFTATGGAGITTYNWSYSGTGVTFSNATATNANGFTFGANATSGIVSVFGTGACGTTPTITYAVTVNPAAPTAFTINGTSPVCQGQNGVAYSVPANPNVTTYSWVYSGTGATITGNNTNAITMNFGATATGGTLTLTETNTCGTINNTFTIAVNPAGALTGPISGPASACQGTGPITYTAAGGTGITTYNWSYSGTGVTFSNATATNTNDLTFSASATSGILSVFGTGACGTTATITYAITVNPAAPIAFIINGTSPVCQGQNGVSYSVPANPGVTTYSWVYSGTGATITGNNTNAISMNFGATATGGTLTLTETNTCGNATNTFTIVVNPSATLTGPISGLTTICQNAAPTTYTAAGGTGITTYNWSYSGTGVTFSNATATNTNTFTFGPTATSGTISVTGTGACGTTAPLTYAVTVNPSAPVAFNITGNSNVCQSTTGNVYFVPAVAGVTYTWTYSGTGATINNNNTNSVSIDFNNVATSGTLQLVETNACGTQTNTFAITVGASPTLTGPLTGTNPVCQNVAPITYTANGGANITQYHWAYTGTGVSFSNTTATNTNAFTFGPFATSGTLSVFGTSSCGTTPTLTMAITVNAQAPNAFVITGSSNVCAGQTAIPYSVPADANVTTWTWSYSGTGATINNNNTNSVNIDFSNAATSGTLTLVATNTCGTQTNTFPITVGPLPTLTGPLSGTNPVCQGVGATTYTVAGGNNITTYNWSYTGTGVSFSNTTAAGNNSFNVGPTATSGTISVTGTNACGTTAPVTLPLTVNPSAPIAFTINGTPNICVNQTGIVYSVPANPNVVTYNWSYSGTGITINNNNTNSITIDFSNVATSGTLTLNEINFCGTTTNTYAITVTPIPAQPGAITGTGTPCQGTNNAFSVAAVPSATTYTWTYSGTGATINNNGTNSITIDFDNTATSGTLSVTASNVCGTSPAQTTVLTVQPGAFQPGNFTVSSTSVCAGSTANYVIPNVVGTSYNWTYSGTGANIISGQGTNAVTVIFANNATSGVLSVIGTNFCGVSAPRSIGVTVNPLPTQPASFISSQATVCQGQSGVNYTVTPDPNATSYLWTYSGSGATINGTGNAVTIDFANNATAGTLSVSSVNGCGTSTALTMAITINPLPVQPGVISGNANPCQGANGVSYSVVNDPNITTYNWTYSGTGAILSPAGNTVSINFANNATSGTLSVTGTNTCGTTTASNLTINVNPLPTQPANFTASTPTVCQGQTGVIYTVPNVVGNTYTWTYTGSGVNGLASTTNSVTLDFTNVATSGTLSVTTTNACGTSTARTIAITVNSVPATPGAISGTNPVCAGTNSVIYSVAAVPTATSYTWTYSGTGALITGTGNSVLISFAANATSGTLSVTANNACGSSTANTLALTVTPIPAQPSVIAGTSPVCANTTNVYSVTPDPNATSYTWTYSGAGAILTPALSSVSINFGPAATSGTLTVTATNACGTSVARTRNITVTPLPSQPGAFTQGTPTVCQGQNGVIYTVPNDPTVTYTWTYTIGTGATINGTGNSVSVDFSNTATTGILNVTATNACGTSIARTINITVNPLPTTPAGLTGTSPVCQGQNGVAFSVTNDPTVTLYTWSYTGTGASITGNGSSILVNFSNTATAGNIQVTATNACGVSAPATFAVSVTPLPAQPSVITGSTTACAGSNLNPYSVINDPNIGFYNWSYSGLGASISGGTNAITINFSNNATSGTLTVTGINACGTSISRSLAITITPLPNMPSVITGPSSVCEGSNGNVYSVVNDPSVTYTWSYGGAGATINGTGSTVTVDYAVGASNGFLSVIAANSCGISTPSGLFIGINPIPANPGSITGNPAACAGTTGNTYSVANVPGTTYTWTYSGGGATITGNGSNAITIDFANNATNGNLSVTATTACGTSPATTVPITINPLPVMPGAISGATPVCANTNGHVYSVANDPLVTYTWTYSGAGATLTPAGNTVSIDFSNVATSGTLSVTATAINGCGTSIARTKAITVNPLPNVPNAPVGLTPVCQGQNGVVYTVLNDPTVTSYTWSYSGTGVSISSFGNNASINFSATATGGDLTVTATNACGTSAASAPLTITVNTLPVTPGAITGTSPVCQGQSAVAYSVVNDPTVSYIWSYSGTGGTIVGGGNAITMNFSNTATSGNLQVIATNGCGISSQSSFTILVNPLPNQPAAFSVFTDSVCAGTNGVVYTIPNDPSVTYTWTYTGGAGATINGTTNSVTVDFSLAATSGTLNVTATNTCGTSIARSKAITIKPLPVTPGAITGLSPVCQGQSGVAYSVPNDPTVTYTWTYSGTGAAIVGTTNAITMNFGATATGGTLSVTATNSCGTSTASTLPIVVNPLPIQPSNITGTSPVCQGNLGVAYSVTNDPTVLNYTWTYTGTGVTINNGTTNSITIDYSNTATSGTLSVTATNACGTSLASTFPITVNPLPIQPAPFTISSTVVCQGQNGVIYAVPNDPTVFYTWTYGGTGATIAGSGNSVALTFSNTATSGTLSVTANNSCGVSVPQTIAITVNPLPTTPGAITGTTPVCQGQTGVAYSVTNDPTVTYNWSYSGLNTSIVGSGNAITLSFGTTATSGTLSVTATNSCGTSTASTMAITVNPLPLQPSTITGATEVCQGQNAVPYAVLNDPTILNYTWTYSGAGATITGTTNAVTIDFSNVATSGNLTVIANNLCGASLARVMAITVDPLPNQPAAFITSTTPVCQGQNSVIYEVPNDPTVTYTWTYTGGTGATINGTGHLVSVDFSNSATLGNLNVTATNNCGTSIARTLAIVVNPLPANPGAITGTNPVCQGQNGVVYTVPAVAGATSYTWSYSGTGATFASITNSVSINFNTVATSGTLKVVPTNACGTSLVASTLAIVVNPLPLKPDFFTVSTDTVCQGQNAVVYTVPNVPGTTYTWTYSGTGATGFNTTNSVSLNFSATATSGTLSVTATNPCGTSAARTLTITVNPLPAQPSIITGTSPVCQGQNNVQYSVTNVPGITYTWTYTGTGAVITGTGSTASVNFSNTATPGNITVVASNACGSSLPRTLPILVNPIPAQPSVIAGLATPCQGTVQNYTVTNVAGTTYSWSYSGTGVTFASTTNTVAITFSNIATSGVLSVTANTLCGQSIARTLAITVNPLPQVPGNFTIMSTSVCQGQNNVVYQVPLDISVTYTWNYTGVGGTITTFGGNTANINFSNIATSGNVTVTATNACGVSAARTVAVTVNPLPLQPAAFTAAPASVCQGQQGVVYTVPNDPTVTYTWSYTDPNVTVLNGNGNTATLNFPINAVSGTLSVIAHNNCGASIARTTAITVKPLPNEPLPFTNSTADVCQGQNNVIYTVPFDPAVTYNWNYTGTGATIVGVTNSVSISFNNAATSGLLTVTATATNGCGTSTPQAIFITVHPLPAAPGAITGVTPVCQGETGDVYSVPYDSSVTYTWTYSGTGATILGTGNLVTLNFSTLATSGTLSVTTTNSCGTSVASTFDITVNQLPRVTASPVNATLCAGGDTSFTITATGTGLVYHWQVNTGTGFNDLVDNATYTGSATATLHLTAVDSAMNGYTYRAYVTGTCYPGDTSGVALLTVNTPPVLANSLSNAIICAGSDTSFTINAVGTALTFQWEVNDGTGWANVPAAAPYSGSTSATLSITAATAGMNGYQYRVTVTGTCAPPQTSNAITLNVNFPPLITIQPASSVVVCTNAPADITVTAIGAGMTYQWQVDNGTGFANITNLTLYSGINTPSLHINAVGPTMVGYQYRVIINGACTPGDTSNVSTVSINTQVQWTGLTNTLWSEPGNWACGVLPTAAAVVTITSTVPNFPQIDIPNAICDSLIIEPGAKVSFTGSNSVLEIKGSIVNNGTFDASQGEVYETGTGTQSIPGGPYAVIRLDGTGDKMINGNTAVTSNLILSNGYMTIGNSDLAIAPTAVITGGNSTSYVVTNGTGRLINTNIGIGGRTGSILYPVGSDNTSYTPLTIKNIGVADDFMVNVLSGIYTSYVNDLPSGPALTNDAVGKTWILDEANPGGSDVALTLEWNTPDELTGFDRNECFLSHYIDPFWHPGTTGPAFGSGPYNVSLAGINTFSPFGVGSAGSPLVVGTEHSNSGNVITLYPNPVTGSEIYVKFENAPKGEVVIRILDMLGKVIAENKVNTTQFAGGVIPVKIEDLASGAYMMQMVDKNNKPIQAIKFNKQ